MPASVSIVSRLARSDLWLVPGLVMAVTGVAGLWRLPYLAAQYGGATFLVLYVAALVLVGWPLLAGQLMLARGQRRDLASLLAWWAPGVWAPVFKAVGFAWLAGVAALLAVYGVIASWLLAYTGRAVGGWLAGRDTSAGAEALSAFVHQPERGLGWLLLFWIVLVIAAVLSKPRYLSALLSSTLFLTGLIGMAVMALVGMPDRVDTNPLLSFGPIGLDGVCQALVQAFHALALGSGLALVLGQQRRPRAAALGPAAGIVAGVMLIGAASCMAWPVMFDAPTRVQLSGVSGLLAHVPTALPGRMAPMLFFIGALLLALTTALVLFEMLVQAVTRLRRISRTRASTAVAGVLLIIGLWIQHDFGGAVGQPPRIADLLTVAASDIVFPLAALLLATLMAIGIDPHQLHLGSGRAVTALWHGLVRHPVRLALIVVAVEGLGLIDVLQRFWSDVP